MIPLRMSLTSIQSRRQAKQFSIGSSQVHCTFAPLHCTPLHCIALQCNAMQCNALHCTALQCNAMQCNAMQYNTKQCNAMQCNAMQWGVEDLGELGDLEIWGNRAQGSGEPGWKSQMNWTHRGMLRGPGALGEPRLRTSRSNSPDYLEVLKSPL